MFKITLTPFGNINSLNWDNEKLFLGLILFLSFFCTQLVTQKIQNKIIIKVGNEIVTSYELKNKIMRSLILLGIEINQDNIDKIKKKSVRKFNK